MREDCPRTASPPDCVDDNLAAAYVDGKLGGADRSRIDRLIDTCATCRRQISELMRVRSTVDVAPAKIGRYEVRRPLGEGGMGVVVAAWDPELDREVAIKLVRGNSADGARRLAREAKAMAKVRHPAVIVVHDAGTIDGADGPEVFVAMELIRGETLADWFARRPPWREVVARCRTAGEGLVAAHAAGLVHRDFKPHNVLCDRDGRVVVTDFGLARSAPGVADAPSAVTTAGGIVGTPAYMAPEQHLGEGVGAAADQFAFAATLYEGLYGQRAFGGTTLAALISEVLSGRIRPPPAGSDAPAALAAVIARGLATDPAARFPSLAEMLAAIDAAIGPAAVSAAPPPRPRWPLLAAGGGALAVVGVVAIALTRGGEGTTAAKPAPTPAIVVDASPPLVVVADAAPSTTWDALGDLPKMDARARAWMPDATLLALVTVGVRPDGTGDLATGAFFNYVYASASRAATEDLRLTGWCHYSVMIKNGETSVYDLTNTACAEQLGIGPPRCSFVEIWRRAIADGADPAKHAEIAFDRSGWLFVSKKTGKRYPDDC